jgi:hypothetical protein
MAREGGLYVILMSGLTVIGWLVRREPPDSRPAS